MLNRKNIGLGVLLISSIAFAGCGGGGGGSSAPPVVPGTQGKWATPDHATLTSTQVANFNNNELYYNVHSSVSPGGQIRGQIDTLKGTFSTDVSTAAFLTGDQVVPPVTTNAEGVGAVSLDVTTKKLTGVLVTTGLGTADLNGILAHIHDGAAGVNGDVVVALSGGPVVWTVPDNTILTDAQITKLNAGGLYFAVHSNVNPAAEIRGQINQQVRFALLSGANEVPAVTTSATGTGLLALDPVTKKVSGFIRTSGITGTGAHVHDAAAGGAVIIPLAETAAGSGIWRISSAALALTDAQVTSFNNGQLYFNVHTTANPGGEIRGPIVAATLTAKSATLNGAQEVPPVTTVATGTGMLVLNSVTSEIAGDITTNEMTGLQAHVHVGAVGVNNPPAVPMVMISGGTATSGGGGVPIY